MNHENNKKQQYSTLMLQKTLETALVLSKDVEFDQNIDHCLDHNGCIMDLGLNQETQNLIVNSLENVICFVVGKSSKETSRIPTLRFAKICKNQNIYYITIKQINPFYEILTLKTLEGDFVLYKFIEVLKQAQELIQLLEQIEKQYPIYLLRLSKEGIHTSCISLKYINAHPPYQQSSFFSSFHQKFRLLQWQTFDHSSMIHQIIAQEEACQANIHFFFKLINLQLDDSIRDTQNYYWLMRAIGKSPPAICVESILSIFTKSLQCFKKLIQNKTLNAQKQPISMKPSQCQDQSPIQCGSNQMNSHSHNKYYQMENDNIQNHQQPFCHYANSSLHSSSYALSNELSMSSDSGSSQESQYGMPMDDLYFFKSQCGLIESKMMLLSDSWSQKYALGSGMLNLKLLKKLNQLEKQKEGMAGVGDEQVGCVQK